MASQRGFTLVEIVAAVTLAALLIGLAVPQGLSFYQSMQFRSGVRETLALLNAARYAAVTQGRAQDVETLCGVAETFAGLFRKPLDPALSPVHCFRELFVSRLENDV